MTKDKHAVALGRRGGKSTSDAKAAAVRANGARGGRPRADGMVRIVPATEEQEWEALAADCGMSLRDFLREAVAHYAEKLGLKR